MPAYGSLHSPSLRKMEHSRVQYGRKSVSLGNIIGDPFALATISISMVSRRLFSHRGLGKRGGGEAPFSPTLNGNLTRNKSYPRCPQCRSMLRSRAF